MNGCVSGILIACANRIRLRLCIGLPWFRSGALRVAFWDANYFHGVQLADAMAASVESGCKCEGVLSARIFRDVN